MAFLFVSQISFLLHLLTWSRLKLEFEPDVFPKQERLQKAEKSHILEMKS